MGSSILNFLQMMIMLQKGDRKRVDRDTRADIDRIECRTERMDVSRFVAPYDTIDSSIPDSL